MRLSIQDGAEADILLQVEWYFEQGLPVIARRFSASMANALRGIMSMPLAASPRHTGNPALSGLRTWPIRGFPEHRLYYVLRDDVLIVVRMLHDKRDSGAILVGQTIEEPGT